MTRARNSQISMEDTPFYHCYTRCVRKAFICGTDKESYIHRKEWITERLKLIATVYAIEVCAYAIMENHYHLVLKVDEENSQSMSDNDVIDRWMRLYNGNVLINRYLKGECHSSGELAKVKEIVSQWRSRLSDISWFMRSLKIN